MILRGQELLGWGPAERSRMMSMTGFSSIPGGLAVRTAIERLGVRRSIQLGLGLSAPQDAMIAKVNYVVSGCL